MLVEYIQKALEKAEYKKIDDGSWFAEIPGFEGVWANGTKVEECRKELIEVLEEWLILKLRDGDPLPVLKGKYKIAVRQKAAVWWQQKQF
jgi:predicted RNase H-like HicB family nuclease